jgi:hypothetical protein
MRAKLYANRLKIKGAAWEYLRLVRSSSPKPTKKIDESHGREAQEILETIEKQNPPEDLDINIPGKTLIDQMDRDFEDMGLVPYWFTDLARSRGEAIHPGSHVFIVGDPSGKTYRTIQVSYDQQSVRVRDAEENEFVLPWEMVKPSSRRNL